MPRTFEKCPEAELKFWSRVDKNGPLWKGTPCWNWIAYCNNKGYGIFYFHQQGAVAHRVSYRWLVGTVPDGLDLDHLCRNRRCVNPAHLEPVSRRINLLRGETLVAGFAAQTHCMHGHPFDLFNTYFKDGARACRACRAATARRFRERHPGYYDRR